MHQNRGFSLHVTLGLYCLQGLISQYNCLLRSNLHVNETVKCRTETVLYLLPLQTHLWYSLLTRALKQIQKAAFTQVRGSLNLGPL